MWQQCDPANFCAKVWRAYFKFVCWDNKAQSPVYLAEKGISISHQLYSWIRSLKKPRSTNFHFLVQLTFQIWACLFAHFPAHFRLSQQTNYIFWIIYIMATCKPEGMVLSAVEHHNLNRPMDILVLAKNVIHQTVDISNDIPCKIFNHWKICMVCHICFRCPRSCDLYHIFTKVEPTIQGTPCKYFHHINQHYYTNVNIYRHSIIVSLFCNGSLWLQCFYLSATYPSQNSTHAIHWTNFHHYMVHCGDICCSASPQALSIPTAHHFLKLNLSCTTVPLHKPYSGYQALFLYSTTMTSAPSFCISWAI